ncbi:MAG TPA: hypothetical protein VFE82_05800 [Ramlibacter sp.]|uniref:hypothetical protein n=1 Tax=Ramlibacter sp. TaxID=1917967 RepID=UPI002D2BA5C3|nr:hypothetical protein [Ramlibacter sp.]HZY17976.1 hypothetical protein [Ramlibacter sp.]
MPTDPSLTRAHFTFLAAHGRLYARNPDGKTIDLGSLDRAEDGWRYVLDGNQLTGTGLPSPQAALGQAAQRMGFLYLDGQFTAVADAGDVPLDQAASIELDIDELQAGERMQDARV